MSVRSILSLIILLFLLTGCGSPAAQIYGPWPTTGWTESTPEEQGMDDALLKQMLAQVDETRLPLHSLLVIRHGVIVLEKYYLGLKPVDKHVLYSITKSFTATLFGIALDQGKLKGVDTRVKDIFPDIAFENTDPQKDAITLEDLLTMSSGMDWVEGDPDYENVYLSEDLIKGIMSMPQSGEPGEAFNYCSPCSHVLLKIVEKAIGMDAVEYAQENLFEPLGITDFTWERTPMGDAIGAWGLTLTPRDMAKFGYLYLHGGVWDGKQVVSKEWVKMATKKHIDTGQRLAYGYQWWIYPTHGAYAAQGKDGQTILVIPDLDIIVVTTARMNNQDLIYDLVDNYVIPAASK